MAYMCLYMCVCAGICAYKLNAYCVCKKCIKHSPKTGSLRFTMALTVFFAILLVAVTLKLARGGTIDFFLLLLLKCTVYCILPGTVWHRQHCSVCVLVFCPWGGTSLCLRVLEGLNYTGMSCFWRILLNFSEISERYGTQMQ